MVIKKKDDLQKFEMSLILMLLHIGVIFQEIFSNQEGL